MSSCSGNKAGHLHLNLNEPPSEDGSGCYVMLTKDQKPISRTECLNPPFKVSSCWSISKLVRLGLEPNLSRLPHFVLCPAFQNDHQVKEWSVFMNFLQRYKKVAIVKSGSCVFYILPPEANTDFSRAIVKFELSLDVTKHGASDRTSMDSKQRMLVRSTCSKNATQSIPFGEVARSSRQFVEESGDSSDANIRHFNSHVKKHLSNFKIPMTVAGQSWGRSQTMELKHDDHLDKKCTFVRENGPHVSMEEHPIDLKVSQAPGSNNSHESRREAYNKFQNMEVNQDHMDRKFASLGEMAGSNAPMVKDPPNLKFSQTTCNHNVYECREEACSRSQPIQLKQDVPLEKNVVRVDPSYLRTLGQVHSGWIFGAIAELVDNSRDAKATKLDISIDIVYSKLFGKEIPMLSIVDDGHGMSHEEILRMVSFGHKKPNGDDHDHIGRFGVGFKTGAMRLGRDAIVLTQTSNSRSVAFLSQSLNAGRDNVEIPIISYCRQGQFMERDTSVQSEALAEYNLKCIRNYSPFNEYFIGEKSALFNAEGTGTQIYIWNLDEWGSDYCLEWQSGKSGESSSNKCDILIRSRRIRSRPGQISKMVPLDYSLRSYLEVIFLDPRMKISVQGSLVKSRPLAKFLSKTKIVKGEIMGKPVSLTVGRCQKEWERVNCGIFLYWHGRLIEAYKRVGGMVHNADMGRGIIGVIDVTNVMSDGNGHVWVHNNKQGFQDCEAYAVLESWLGNEADKYWDENYDSLLLVKGDSCYKPDEEWVQCDKCRKWRKLESGFDTRKLPQEWFCQLEPYNGSCKTPEELAEPGVITVAAKRSGYELDQKYATCEEAMQKVHTTEHKLSGDSDEDRSTLEEDNQDVKHRGVVLKRLRRGPARAHKKA
ncbi:PREDICTED: protein MICRORCHIDIA 6-like [Nelumbo nucifera]|uniref:Protein MICRORCHIDIA 6-like n=2 Tax=Nelumbo nucifera TaxID=4432 RepID=A0A1U8ARM0_NELNU|nr:PREDICTED: protein MICRORCHIDIA 6-like [Nelumbo nucifera]XP_010270558.1 PREDICTED: protein MICRORCHIDIA 6-like [Nelumbo nucifera]DAD46488.1 TPA_asm: hypothetical protein HUJ06_016425 [Nelumbo nucifera]